MGTAIGASLPYAVGAALSPLPITAVTLILLAHRGRVSTLFVGGRVFGYAVVLAIAIAASELIRVGTYVAPSPVGEIARFGLGALAVGAGIWTWLRRPAGDAPETESRWMRALGKLTPVRSAGLGFALSAGPKSLVLVAGGGLAIAGASVTPPEEALAGIVFVVIATSTALVPVVLYYALGVRGLSTLRSLQDWMQRNSAGIGAALLILLGVVLIGSGITGL